MWRGIATRLYTASVILCGVGNVAPLSAQDGSTDKRQPSGIAVTVGLNRVDPAHYGGWSGDLVACENDANDMAAIAQFRGFSTTPLRTARATRQAVLNEIAQAASVLRAGDIFMLSYSGHGGQIPDVNGDDEDGSDETWCLYDGELIDDELAALWTTFSAGVRVLVFSDSCHSGTITRFREYSAYLALNGSLARAPSEWHTDFESLLEPPATPTEKPAASPVRAMPAEVAALTYRQHREFYDTLGRETASSRDSEAATNCTVLLISGCQDNQLSSDGPVNGLFTAKLKYVWNSGLFLGTYRDFHRAILRHMPSYQSPNYYVIGASNPQFERQTPFTR